MIRSHGGSGLIEKYHGSPSKLLASIYPEYREKCKQFVLRAVRELKVATVADLVHVPIEYQRNEEVMTYKICEGFGCAADDAA